MTVYAWFLHETQNIESFAIRGRHDDPTKLGDHRIFNTSRRSREIWPDDA